MAANPQILSSLHEYVASKTGKPVTGGEPKTGGGNPKPPERIPLPDYNDPKSRQDFANKFREMYGKESLAKLGDIPLRVNEKAFWASDTGKNLAVKFGNQYKLNPALLYSSAMIEGMSGLYPDAKNSVNTWSGNKEYPVSSAWNFGLDSFKDRLPELQKKGYLPADFQNNFTVGKDVMFKDPTTQAVLFKNTDAGFQAKAAMMRQYYDETDDYTKKKNLTLTPEQRDFFALAHFNSGAHGYEMMDAYSKAGLLKNNDFITQKPNIPIEDFVKFYKGDTKKAEALHNQIYGNITPRLAAARGLTEQQLFDPPTPSPVVQK